MVAKRDFFSSPRLPFTLARTSMEVLYLFACLSPLAALFFDTTKHLSLVDTNAVFIHKLFQSRHSKIYTFLSTYIFTETKDVDRFLAPSGRVFMGENAQSQWTLLVFYTLKNLWFSYENSQVLTSFSTQLVHLLSAIYASMARILFEIELSPFFWGGGVGNRKQNISNCLAKHTQVISCVAK